MGDDHACKTLGIRKVRLKLHDGSIHTLFDVRYELNLKKNLISLGTLEFKGYHMTTKDEALKVTKGSMIMMRGTRLNNCIFLQGSTVIVRAITVCSDNGEDALDSKIVTYTFKPCGREGHARPCETELVEGCQDLQH